MFELRNKYLHFRPLQLAHTNDTPMGKNDHILT
jgi:hypothetical protein